jgi:hypothetical protein
MSANPSGLQPFEVTLEGLDEGDLAVIYELWFHCRPRHR